MSRRPGRPVSCPLDQVADVCTAAMDGAGVACPNLIPPCEGIANRALCPAIKALAGQVAADDAAAARAGKPRLDLDAAIAAVRKARGI